jgi:branched-chain amino acid transport system ATP-binding protein
MAELEIEELCLSFGGLTVLDRVSLAVDPAELLALIGPNGAGKTSVLNCISGIYRGQGRIRFRGSDVAGLSSRAIARLGIARTFQHSELFRHMSVLDKSWSGVTRASPPTRWRRPCSSAACDAPRCCIARPSSASSSSSSWRVCATPRPAPLPFGTQKIVGLARALALEPSLLLLDEPSAGLSRDERDDLARFILRIKHELKLPMIWIEHDMQMVADLADRIHVLDYGRTLASGVPDQVLKNPAVVSAYLGVRG